MNRLTILSHNAFWFQGVPFTGDQPGEPNEAILRQLCDRYRECKADVVCLQEVQSRSVFERLSEELDMPGSYCPGLALPQYGGAIFWRPEGGRLIRISQEAGSRIQRMWQIIVLPDFGGVRICNVHLSSGRQVGEDRAAAQRLAETREALLGCDGGPDIMAGDFNEHAGKPVSRLLEAEGYFDSAALTGCADVPTNIGGTRGDFIWIRKSLRAGLRDYSVAGPGDLACRQPGKQYLSDHLPLRITLVVS